MAAAARGVKYGQEKRAEREAENDPKAVFAKYDADGGGSIDADELGNAFKELRVTVTKEQLDTVVTAHGRDGGLEVDAFVKLVAALRMQQEAQAEAKKNNLPLQYGQFTAPYQENMIAFYNHPVVVYSVASCIIGNFLINILEKEIDPMGNLYTSTWNALDTLFNLIFLGELLCNLYQYAGPRKRFWRSAWNCFDFFIVTVGVVLMIGGDALPAPLKKLKLLRALRVFRLFKRVKSLNQIIVALIASIPGVANAFVIMIIFFCIYAILAVELFGPFGETGEYPIHWQASCVTVNGSPCALPEPNDDGSLTVSAMTARGYTNGYEYYGTFGRALFTLFQVMTGESWAEAIARPLIFGLESNAVISTIFFVSFIILTQIVLINVVVAVLLDKFTAGDEEEEPDEVDAAQLLELMDRDLNGPVLAESSTTKAKLGLSKALPPPPPNTPEEKMNRILSLLESLDKRLENLEKKPGSMSA